MYTIYMHINKINHKVYIGQTKQDLKKRWNKGEGYRGCPFFYAAIKKYGWDNFQHKVLIENLTLNQANFWEQFFIQYFDSNNLKKGYNIRIGGNNSTPTLETKIKISNSNIGKHNHKGINNPFYGKHHTEETKQLLSAKKQKENLSKKTREKMREAKIGTHRSLETKIKISKATKGSNNPASKRIRCIETGQIFGCIQDAAEWCGLKSRTSINNFLAGRSKSAGTHPITKEKLHWEYV